MAARAPQASEPESSPHNVAVARAVFAPSAGERISGTKLKIASPTDEVLVEAALAGDTMAHELLFQRHVQTAHGLAVRLLANRADAEDVVQEGFVDALTTLDRLKDRTAFRAWLRGIIVRKCGRSLRGRRLQQRLGAAGTREAFDVDSCLNPGAPPDAVVELRSVYRTLDDLPAEERVALVLHRIEGESLPRVAELMGRSLATVKRRLQQAEHRLSQEFELGARSSPKGD